MPPRKVALAGNPNSGKTALFNALTHGRQKVGNYPGVTVERKEGHAQTKRGQPLIILDLPGVYSLDARTPDEMVTQSVLLGREQGENGLPDGLIVVVDATSLQRSLAFVLELKALGIPLVLALNMMDLAEQRGEVLDLPLLSELLGISIIPTVATREQGTDTLLAEIEKQMESKKAPSAVPAWKQPDKKEIQDRFKQVDQILERVIQKPAMPLVWMDRIDRVLLHPFWGLLILGLVLTLVFQAIFTWAHWPMDAIETGIDGVGHWLSAWMAEGALKSLLIDGILSGSGAVLVFLPQILLLFLFLQFLEDSGYMARAAFLMDRIMHKVGLHGRAFIPILSSYACAVPGIMATRTIENPRDRLTTILVIPLITCSARLPVYSLLVGAFIPARTLGWGIGLQGLVMFGLFVAGVVAALCMALLFRRTLLKGAQPPLVLEMPSYKWPSWKNIAIGMWEKGSMFVVRVGTIILGLSVLLWFLASYPKAPEGALVAHPEIPAITYSAAGQMGKVLEPIFRPIGFNWEIAVALIPGFMAREIMVGALATVYAIDAKNRDDQSIALLGSTLAKHWSLATALSLLVWYILSCQCFSTLAVTKRETNSWRWPIFMMFYMTVLAYACSFVTYHGAVWLGLG